MADDDDDFITFNEEEERNWRQWLTEFKEKVYPVFQEYGTTLPEAMMLWKLQSIYNKLEQNEDA